VPQVKPPAEPAPIGEDLAPPDVDLEPDASKPPPSFPEDFELPEDTRLSDGLADDVPVPEGADLLFPPLESPEATVASYATRDSVGSVRTSLTTRLLGEGWSITPARPSESGALIRAAKGNRQLAIAIDTVEGRTQVVITETESR
jgi:hypothetical protein